MNRRLVVIGMNCTTIKFPPQNETGKKSGNDVFGINDCTEKENDEVHYLDSYDLIVANRLTYSIS